MISIKKINNLSLSLFIKTEYMNMKDYLDKIFNRDKYYDLDSYIQDKDDNFGYLDHYTIQ